MTEFQDFRFGDGIPDCHSDEVSRILAEEAQFTALLVIAGKIQLQDVDEAKRVFDSRFDDERPGGVGTSFDTSFPGASRPILTVLQGGK